MRSVAVIGIFGALALLFHGVAHAEVIELESGEKIEGEVIERNDEVVVIEHATFGRLEIPVDQIEQEDPGPGGLFGTSFLAGWNKNVSVGVNGSQGKSKEANVNVNAFLKHQDETSRDQFEARYYFSRSERRTSDNQLRSTYVHDFLFPEKPWFPFIGLLYRYEGENDWEHRIGGNAGLGYQFIARKDLSLRGRLGIGYTRTQEDKRDNSTGPNPEGNDIDGFLRLSVIWTVAEGQTLSASHLYTPILNGLPEFRNRSLVEYKVAIGVIRGLGITVGGSFDYDSTVQGKNQRDGKFFLTLGYDF